MSYTVPTVTELGSVHALTLAGKGNGGGAGKSGDAPAVGKTGGVRDGLSDVIGRGGMGGNPGGMS